jgi:hypothetical protein
VLKSKPRKILKALLRNAFKIFLLARLIGNCCNIGTKPKRKRRIAPLSFGSDLKMA